MTGIAEVKIVVVPLKAAARFGPQRREDMENTIHKLELPTSQPLDVVRSDTLAHLYHFLTKITQKQSF